MALDRAIRMYGGLEEGVMRTIGIIKVLYLVTLTCPSASSIF